MKREKCRYATLLIVGSLSASTSLVAGATPLDAQPVQLKESKTASSDASKPESHSDNAATHQAENLNVQFKDIDVRTVLKTLSDISGKGILVSDTVRGNISIDFVNTTWQQALDAICNQAGLKQRQSGGVILIEPK